MEEDATGLDSTDCSRSASGVASSSESSADMNTSTTNSSMTAMMDPQPMASAFFNDSPSVSTFFPIFLIITNTKRHVNGFTLGHSTFFGIACSLPPRRATFLWTTARECVTIDSGFNTDICEWSPGFHRS